MAEGPPSAGVRHINEHGRKNFGGILECCWTDNKGRIVHATRTFEQGEVILRESPLHIVQEDPKSQAFSRLKELCKDHEFDYEPLWYWCALKSLTKEQLRGAKCGGWAETPPEVQHNLLLLHHDVTEPGNESKVMAQELVPNAEPLILERLVQVWVLNCFEFSDTPQGYSTYFFSSFMSHSCYPNAVWHYTGKDHVLRARRSIAPGDEVCIAYLPEDGLLQPVPMRRWELHQTKHFWCTCERCTGPKDPTRGMHCPKCKEGLVFAKAEDSACKRAQLQASGYDGVICQRCPHKITHKEAQELAHCEDALKKMVDDFTQRADDSKNPVTPKEVEKAESLINNRFPQHSYADNAWEQLAELAAKNGNYIEQRRFLKYRAAFHKAAYAGLSGTHAWSLEACGDALQTTSQASPQTRVKGKQSRAWTPVAKAETQEAIACYTESERILTLMFGSDHEYTTCVTAKLKAARETLAAAPEAAVEAV